jgi:ubiquinone/menaquinone biosynthesis C-methylase UbiE
MTPALFDTWTEKYESWFTTPVGQLVKRYESELLLTLLDPLPGESILDVGCGIGIFTQDILRRGARVTGVDISLPMLSKAIVGFDKAGFTGLCADMNALPFADGSFDKVYSMTVIEFSDDAGRVVAELDRVVRKGGRVVVTTLNNLSPWAAQRTKKGQAGHPLFQHIRFRSPEDMRRIVPGNSVIATAIHFDKNAPVAQIPEIETNGKNRRLETGALLAVQWEK